MNREFSDEGNKFISGQKSSPSAGVLSLSSALPTPGGGMENATLSLSIPSPVIFTFLPVG